MKSKRILLCILSVLAALSLSLFLFGCSDDSGDDEDEECTHEWTEATCTEPRICVLCSETEGEPLGHRGGTANCTNGAICDFCGFEYTESNSSVHAEESVWIKDRTSHYKLYECCNTNDTASESHQIVNGVCPICGFNPTVSVSDATVTNGTSVSVAVSLNDNPGILGLELSVTYNESALTLVNAEKGEALESFTFTSAEAPTSGSKFLWDAIEEAETDILNGELLILTFELTENAINVDYNIILKAKAYDGELNSIYLTVTNGIITVNRE